MTPFGLSDSRIDGNTPLPYMKVQMVDTNDCETKPSVALLRCSAQTSARGRGKSELAQLWKDMKRDTVSINGRVMTGEQGPEGIIGALTRCILAQVKPKALSSSFTRKLVAT